VSVGFGNTWTQAGGVPTNAVVESDRVNPQKFYALSGGQFFVSTNGGAAFTRTAATGLPDTGKFKAVPGRDGDIWLAGSGGLWHSTNSGASFMKLAAVTDAHSVGFGKAAPGRDYPAIFAMATVDGVSGVYRSDDGATSWVRINDDKHQYGNAGDAITGDPRVYGRVYLGTNGRGVLYADRTGAPPSSFSASPSRSASASPSRSASASPSRSASASVSASPSRSASASASVPTGRSCGAVFTVVNGWNTGYQADITVRNTGTTQLNGWQVVVTFPDGRLIDQMWGGTYTRTGNQIVIIDLGWNGQLAPNATASVGLILTGPASPGPLNVTCAPR